MESKNEKKSKQNKIKIDSQKQGTNWWLPEGRAMGGRTK